MLMNTIKKSYRNFINSTDSVLPMVAASGIRQAANSSAYAPSEMQVRRQRRQSRLASVAQHGSIGWRVSAW